MELVPDPLSVCEHLVQLVGFRECRSRRLTMGLGHILDERIGGKNSCPIMESTIAVQCKLMDRRVYAWEPGSAENRRLEAKMA